MSQISVIVPIYGVEQWLKDCIDSILAQTFDDFECILVDDGSQDHCPAICDAYAKNDPRIVVIHRKNGGLSAARNSGIKIAKSPYLAFIDADDTVAPTFLQKLFSAIKKQNADIAICSVEDVLENGTSQTPAFFTSPDKAGTFAGKDLLPLLYSPNGTYYSVAWNKLYKADLWKALRYPEGYIHEDDAVAHELLFKAPKIVCLPDSLYFYRLRNGSICRTAFKPTMFDGAIALAQRYHFCKKNQCSSDFTMQTAAACAKRFISVCSLASADASFESHSPKKEEAQRAMRGMKLDVLRNKELTLLEKASFFKQSI